ncbi:alpha/beta hydrolase [Actinoallomurus sp. NPDC050550]|uniref:alpha/beta fold hydrolase n=1 Tax=Actinoallomurus sp. NPDC050550 TaxID=3154937 RepID=UPI0033FFB3CD
MRDPGTVRLFHTDHGSGDIVLLLVHGWGGDGREWSPHVEALAGRHRVIVPDLRGHGRSDVPAEDNTPRAMARDLAALIARLAAGPVVAVGHSMGGQVVNLLAVEHPEAIHSVIALDPAHGADGDEVADIPRRLRTYQANGATAAAEFVAAAFSPNAPTGLRTAHVRTMLGTPDHVIVQAYAGMYTDRRAVGIREHSEAYLRLRKCPALTVWTSAAHADWEGGLRLPGARVEHWPGVGHYLHEERFTETVRLIEQWSGR